MDRRRVLSIIGLSSLTVPFLARCSKEKEPQQGSSQKPEEAEKDELVDLLFVQEAEGVRFEGDGMTLVNVNPQTLFFSDRPEEIAGYLSFSQFIKLVSEGPDNFKEDPPNATIVIMEGEDLVNVVLSLPEKPYLKDKDLVFPSVSIIQGDPPAAGGATALFIDVIGRPLSPLSIAGVHRRHRRRRRRAMRRR